MTNESAKRIWNDVTSRGICGIPLVYLGLKTQSPKECTDRVVQFLSIWADIIEKGDKDA